MGEGEVFIIGSFALANDKRWHNFGLDGLSKHDKTTSAAIAVTKGVNLFKSSVSYGHALNEIVIRGIKIIHKLINFCRDREVIREGNGATHDSNSVLTVITSAFDDAVHKAKMDVFDDISGPAEVLTLRFELGEDVEKSGAMIASLELFADGFVGQDGVVVVQNGGDVFDGHSAAFDVVGMISEIEGGELEKLLIF